MPTSVTPTLVELRDLIKKESRVSGADNLDSFIDALINELLCDFAQKNRYFELLTMNEVVLTVLNTGTYDLPDDFVAMRLVRYKQTNSNYTFTLNKRPEYIETARGRRPRWYDISGNFITVFPNDDVPAGDSLLLDYYKFPQTLVGNSVFPIPKLVAPVKLEAIRRTLIYNQQLQEAQILKGDSTEQEVRTRMND